MKINEMFTSIQGEGAHAGKMAFFIRFCYCNLHCTFCDTEFRKVNIEMTVDDLVEEILKHKKEFQFVVLTGGEPALEPNLPLLCRKLYQAGIKVHIETNGTIPGMLSEVRKDIDWLTVSPKIPADDSTGESILLANEVKFVYTDKRIWETYKIDIDEGGAEKYIQPCSEDYAPVIEFIKQNPDWTISVQLHKVLGLK